jgi:EmrB/QacA subfamily drug resistance transporter
VAAAEPQLDILTRPVPSAPTARLRQRRGNARFLIIVVAHLMAVLDGTMVIVALPSIGHGLALTVAGRQWVITAYTLSLAGLVLVGGRLVDRFGARRGLVVGATGFAIASAVGGGAPDGATLIVARAAQGAAGALLISATKANLIGLSTDPTESRRLLAIFSATMAGGGVLGLILGGVVTDLLGWRWCLWVNVPLAIVAAIGGRRLLGAAEPARVRIDVISALAACVGLGALVYGLSEAGTSGTSALTVTSLVLGAASLGGFIRRQSRSADPLLPLRVVWDRQRGWALIALVLNGLSTVEMMLILTFQLQNVRHLSPLVAGLALAPFAVGSVIGATLITPRLAKMTAPARLLGASVTAEALALVPLLWIGPHSRYLPLLFLAVAAEGIATGIAAPLALRTALNGAAQSDRGAVSACSSAASQLGSSLGAALLSTLAGTAARRAVAKLPASASHGFARADELAIALLLLLAVPILRSGAR